VPGYLATVCGRAPSADGFDRAVLQRSLVFIGGFSFVFIALGLSATALGELLFENQETLRRLAGAFILAMGAFLIASLAVVRLNRDWRLPGLAERARSGGPLVAGVAFAFAWTPCVGPTLGAILGLASFEQSLGTAAALLAAYSLGLAVPFLLASVGFARLQGRVGWLRRHARGVQLGFGVVLIAMGALVFSGELFRLNIEAQKLLDGLGLNFFQSV
jgi:cytochrome c-type biogenesis protein